MKVFCIVLTCQAQAEFSRISTQTRHDSWLDTQQVMASRGKSCWAHVGLKALLSESFLWCISWKQARTWSTGWIKAWLTQINEWNWMNHIQDIYKTYTIHIQNIYKTCIYIILYNILNQLNSIKTSALDQTAPRQVRAAKVDVPQKAVSAHQPQIWWHVCAMPT